MPSGRVADGPERLLGGLRPADFLQRHWQREPLVVVGAVEPEVLAIEPEELAALACEPEVESRLVFSPRAGEAWELRHGPFSEHELRSLPEAGWTLLVQSADRYLPAAASLLARFDFIPRWRLDDVMISYSPAGGTVGPHVDSYDVFLVQARGAKRWGIQRDPAGDCPPDTEMRVLSRFVAEQEWLLEAGDLLYLPPGVAHSGIAEGIGQTWSVGLRAPTRTEMLQAMAEHLALERQEDIHYRDPQGRGMAHPNEITGAELSLAQSLVLELVRDTDPAAWFGMLASEQRAGPEPEPPETPASIPELRTLLGEARGLRANPLSRFLFHEVDRDTGLLFVDGEVHPYPRVLGDLVHDLCAGVCLERNDLKALLGHEDLARLLQELYNAGRLELVP